MAKLTKRDKIVAALLERGCEEMDCRSGKYRQFNRPEVEGSYLFVGKKGAVRVGRVATKSLSITNSKWVQKILLDT